MRQILRVLVPVFVLSAVPAEAQRSLSAIAGDLEALAVELRGMEPDPPQPASTTVPAGGDLQAALDAGGLIDLEAGAVYEGRFVARTSGTTLRGNGATIRGVSGPALYVPPGVSDVTVQEATFATVSYDLDVIVLGDNSATTQGSLELVPQRITLSSVRVPTHRGKRAIAVHAADVLILNAEIADVWDPALRDSQAVWIGNTPGPVTIRGGTFSAGSEVIMVGGDTIKIPGAVPSDILIEHLQLWRPLEWRTDGVNRNVKNLLELKAGRRVTVRNVEMRGNWQASQPGYAIVVTPKNGQIIQDVLIDTVDVRDTAAIFNILGADYNSYTPAPLSGFRVINSTFVTDKTTYGGNGLLAQVGAAPVDLTFEDNIAITDGSSMLLGYYGSIKLEDGTTVTGGRIGSLVMQRNYLVAGLYGISLNGSHNGANWAESVDALTFAANTVTARNETESYTRMRSVFPDNTYIPRSEFDALFNPDWSLK